jgi:hypothetical protein
MVRGPDPAARARDRRLRDVLTAHGATAVNAVGDRAVAACASAGAAIASGVEHAAANRR